MEVYLIKENSEYKTFNNVIEWNTNYVICKVGKGTMKVYASENEYFTDKIIEN